MTDKEKKIVFTIIAILVIILIIVICIELFEKEDSDYNTVAKDESTTIQEDDGKYTVKLNDGTRLNNSEDLKTIKTYKTVQIMDIRISSKNGDSTILANVKNTGATEFEEEDVTLALLGENGEVITTVPATIPKTAPGQTTQINTMITVDVADVKDFKIEVQ